MAVKPMGQLNNNKRPLDEGMLDDLFTVMKGLPRTFSDTLKYHMKRLDITVAELAEAADLSDKIIGSYRNDIDSNPELPTVMALIIGLHLEPEFAEDLIDKAGHKWRTTQRDIFFRRLIWQYCNEDEDIYSWNDRIEAVGIKQHLPRN